MDFDKPLRCKDCKHHEKLTCARIQYNEYHYHIGLFWFYKPHFASHSKGHICNKFELIDFYYNSPSYKDFTLDGYIIYRGIEKLEHRILSKTGFSKRTTCDGKYTFEFLRNQTRKGYVIWQGNKEIKHYRGIEWSDAFADWLDICRASEYTKEYIEDVKEAFLGGAVLLCIKDDNKNWYVMKFRDWFNGNLYREDGLFNVLEQQWYSLPIKSAPYVLNHKSIEGIKID